ncbi:hypothetical protein [Bacillus pumilus]|uniref:hypothetical protein n=1 Tax=Bacillus pumilus TaxID=1408 RepID=UPI002282B15A|nr:hypothetical protein [Bacillus pumilus]MCY7572115.1 hypothetical protein [Bacillus pumilus]MEC3761825.1 hypothetical protein [Bacillus pumilus]
MFSSILMVLLAFCVLAAGFLTLKRELAAEPPIFASKKEAKEEMLGLFRDRGFFYLTAIALFMEVIFKRAQIVPFDFFQVFLASSGVQALFYLIKRKDMGVKAVLVVLVSFLFLFF